ncbi:MAG: electron transfer flavoprotein subunit beta/FixA family protein [Planctomycetota bacterium]|nr:electron transfer flavoprotein subunit beta/FixA family protein [Planctomycetota bacterium]
MPYNCVVCVKQVPDTKRITGEAMTPEGTVNRAALPAIFNPEDLNALEEALAVRELFGGTVTVVTMGLPTACAVLREPLARGADRVVLITDRRAAASDTLATSYILSCAIKKMKADIVLCGRPALDGDTAQVGPQLAEKLGLPLITYVEQLVGLKDGVLHVRRNIGNGWEEVSCRLPALLTVMETANVPRPPAVRRLMKTKKARCVAEVAKAVEDQMPAAAPEAKAAETKKRADELAKAGLLIEQWTLDDIQADLTWCGKSGSPTKVHRIQAVVLTGGEYHEYPPTDDGAAQLISALIEDHTIG